MSKVALTINGRSYQVGCDDGQEERLIRLAEMVDARVRDLVASLGQIGDSRLLVMAALLLADELDELRQAPPVSADQEALATGMEALAARIEDLAGRLESA